LAGLEFHIVSDSRDMMPRISQMLGEAFQVESLTMLKDHNGGDMVICRKR
jgi:hypothetical protein